MADAPALRAGPRRLGADAVVAIVATLIAILPVLAVVVSYSGRHYLPVGDYAVIDSRVRDVWSSNLPLLGMYSRFGWYHPGPAMFWSIAPLSLVAGGAAWATLVGSALLQGGAVVWSARVAWRRGGVLLVLAVLAWQWLSYAGIASFLPLQRPWNPFVAFPFLPLFLLLVWSAGLGEVREIPWIILVGSYLVETHSGYALMVLAGLVWTACFAWRRRRDPDVVGQWRRILTLSGVVLVVLWAAPLLVQLRDRANGNVVHLAQFFVLGDVSRGFAAELRSQPLGFPLAPQLFAAEFRWLPTWLGGRALVEVTGPTIAAPASLLLLLVPLALLGIGILMARHRHNRAATHAVVLAAILTAVGIFSLSRVRGAPTDFVFYWRVTLSVLIVLASLGAVLTSVRLWTQRGVRAATGVLLAAALVVPVSSMTAHVLEGDPELRQPGRVVASLVHQLDGDATLRSPALLLTTNVQVSIGVFDELNRKGEPVYVSKYFSDRYFEGKHQAPRQVGQVWFLVQGTEVSQLAALPNGRELASITPFSRRVEERIRTVQATLAGQLVAAHRKDLLPQLESPLVASKIRTVPGVDLGLARELARLRRSSPLTGYRFAVFSFPPNAVPKQFLVV